MVGRLPRSNAEILNLGSVSGRPVFTAASSGCPEFLQRFRYRLSMKLIMTVAGVGLLFNSHAHTAEGRCNAAHARCFKGCEAKLEEAFSKRKRSVAYRHKREASAQHSGRQFLECQHGCNAVFVRCR